jgi:hypothetical protein
MRGIAASNENGPGIVERLYLFLLLFEQTNDAPVYSIRHCLQYFAMET